MNIVIQNFLSLNKNLRFVTIPQHILLITALTLMVTGVFSFWWLLVMYLGWFFIGFIGFNIFYHRYHSHKSFKTYRSIEILGTYLGLLSGRGSPLYMVNTHVPLHHAYSDTELDPHTPLKGFWFAYILWQNDGVKLNIGVVRSLLRDSVMKYMSDNYYKIFWLTFFILCLLSVPFAIFFMIGAGVLQTHSEGIIATFGHSNGRWGSKDHPTGDNSCNLRGPFNWITLGSALHNNHHLRPGSYTYIIDHRDIDVAKYVIKFISKSGTLKL